MKFFMSVIKGFFIGCGAILPGISSGVLCVILGLYDKLVDSIIHFFHDWKKNFLFLFPILIGIGIGVVLFSHILKFLFATYLVPTKFAFIGLILSSVPILLKKANEEKRKFQYCTFFFLTFFFSLGLTLLEEYIPSFSSQNPHVLTLVLAGFLMSAGIVIPGVSSTVILMLCGVYSIYLNAISVLDISVLFPMGIGLILGSFLFLRIIQYCFEHFSSQTYYAITRFCCWFHFCIV